MTYKQFIDSKAITITARGLDVPADELNQHREGGKQAADGDFPRR